jgi:hypothetical protein
MNPSFYDRAKSAATDGTFFSGTKGVSPTGAGRAAASAEGAGHEVATDKVRDINQSRSECTDTFEAAKNGHLKCLKYFHENGYLWNEYTCAVAAKYGHLKCLKYLHKNGCPWNEYTCALAAKYGHLKCLQYARENGCPCAEYNCAVAEKYGHLMCPYCRAPISTPPDLLKEAILEQKDKLDFLFKVFIIIMLLWILLFVFFLMETRPLAPLVKPPPANASFVNSFVRS